MKILLDENLSWRLVKKLMPHFEEVMHVIDMNVSKPAQDLEIWNFAKTNGYTIITKDDDFEKLVLLRKAPPKVIYLKTFNLNTNQLSDLLIKNKDKINIFNNSNKDKILEIYTSQ